MRSKAFAWGLALLLGAAQASESCKRVVVSADPEFPPYAWYDGKTLRGASVEVVIKVLDVMKLPYELRYVGPFVRLLARARDGEVDVITELKRNAEREAFLAYADTPIFSNPTSVFVRQDSPLQLVRREDLVGLRGGVTHGTRFGDGLDEFIAERLTTESAPGIKENFAKLERGRLDYFVSPHYPALSYLFSSGGEGQFKVLKPPVAEALNYVGWSRLSPCLARLAEFDQHLQRYLKGLDSPRLLDQHHVQWQRHPVMLR